MGWFFTKAALLTFGGAYAVLPYVYQGAVEHYGWLSGAQMIDGLALGETRQGRSSWWWRSSVPGRLGAAGAGPGGAVPGCSVGGDRGDLVHLPAVIHFHSGRWAVGGVHPRPAATERTMLTAITAAVVGVILQSCSVFCSAYRSSLRG